MTESTQIVQPYLFFNGRCEEALEFYRQALGAEVQTSFRYKDSPEPPPPDCVPPDFEDKIMHCSFRIGSTVLMASDGDSADASRFAGFSLSLSLQTAEEASRAFEALQEGGNVVMPLGKTFFSPQFGMVTDRFGVMWMVIVRV